MYYGSGRPPIFKSPAVAFLRGSHQSVHKHAMLPTRFCADLLTCPPSFSVGRFCKNILLYTETPELLMRQDKIELTLQP